MEALEKLVRGLVGEAALEQIKGGEYEGSVTSQLPHDYDNASSGDETAPPQSSAAGAAGPQETLDNLNLAMGQLTILPEAEGGTLYAGGTAWDAVFAQFAELKTLLKQARDSGLSLPESAPQMAVWTGSGGSNITWAPSESIHSHADDEIVGANEFSSCFPFSNCTPPTMAEVISLLPSPTVTLKLLDKFFNSLLPFNKIVHYETFMKEYAEYEKSPKDAKSGWIALLFTMLSSAVTSFSPQTFATFNDTDLTHEETGRKFHRGAKAALVHAQFLRSHSLTVVQALVLLQISIHPDEMAGV